MDISKSMYICLPFTCTYTPSRAQITYLFFQVLCSYVFVRVGVTLFFMVELDHSLQRHASANDVFLCPGVVFRRIAWMGWGSLFSFLISVQVSAC